MRHHLPGAVILLALAPAASAQERPLRGPAAADWFPLRAGAQWRYRRTDAAGARGEVLIACRGVARAGSATAFELCASDGGEWRYEYWRTDAAGVWRHPTLGDGAARGMLALPAARWLACPLGLETTWSFEDQRPDHRIWVTLGGPPTRPKVEPGTCRASLLDASARVTAPAGEYVAACVRIDRTPLALGAVERTLAWFARGVGPVRRETFTVEGEHAVLTERLELVEYLEVPDARDPLAMAAGFVASHAELWPAGEPVLATLELPCCDIAIVSRFVRARSAAGPALLHVAGASVAPFDPERLVDVQGFFAVESPDLAAGGDPPPHELNRLARAYFSLRAALDGTATEGTALTQMASGGGAGGPRGRFRYGRGDLLEICFRGGELERLVYRIQ